MKASEIVRKIFVITDKLDPLARSLMAHAASQGIQIQELNPQQSCARFYLEKYKTNEIYYPDTRFIFRDISLTRDGTDDEQFVNNELYAFCWGLGSLVGERAFNGSTPTGLAACIEGDDISNSIELCNKTEYALYVSSKQDFQESINPTAWSRNQMSGEVTQIATADANAPLRTIEACLDPYYERVFVVGDRCFNYTLSPPHQLYDHLREASVQISKLSGFDFCDILWRISEGSGDAFPLRIDPHHSPTYAHEAIRDAIWDLVIA